MGVAGGAGGNQVNQWAGSIRKIPTGQQARSGVQMAFVSIT